MKQSNNTEGCCGPFKRLFGTDLHRDGPHTPLSPPFAYFVGEQERFSWQRKGDRHAATTITGTNF